MPHTTHTTTTLLATLGLFTFAPLAIAAEGDVPATVATDQAIDESLETEDSWIDIELAEEQGMDQSIEVVAEPAVESVETQVLTEASEAVDPDELIATPIDPANESRVISMDRSHWPTITVSPIDGRVTHHPHFTGEAPLGEDIVTPLHAPDPVWQLQEALAGAHAGNLNGENLSALGSQPIVGLTQFVLMPARMILENPWSKETSPGSP